MDSQEHMTPKAFIDKIFAGTALGVVIGVLPNSILAQALKYFAANETVAQILHIAVVFQMAIPFMMGALIGLQFNFKPMQTMIVASVSFVASGVVKYNPSLNAYPGAGTGDLINTMITASIAVLLLRAIKDKFGSVAVVAMPLLVGVGVSFIGMLLLPYVSYVTTAIGQVVNSFTTLEPVIMSILVCCAFAFIIVSPVSTVAISLAIKLDGVAAGAAAMGVAVTAIVLVVHSWTVNKPGVTLAMALGAMKLMMTNVVKYPIVLLPCMTTAVVSAIPVALFSIQGIPESGGLGLIGLVGPLVSIDFGLNIVLALVAWFLVPIFAAILSKLVLEKILKLYDSSVVFKFEE